MAEKGLPPIPIRSEVLQGTKFSPQWMRFIRQVFQRMGSEKVPHSSSALSGNLNQDVQTLNDRIDDLKKGRQL